MSKALSRLTAALAIAASGTLAVSRAQTQTPTFRAAVDLIAVDVQVLTRGGDPFHDLNADAFSVTIDGHDRRVVSVDHISHPNASPAGGTSLRLPTAVGPSASNQWPASGPIERTFLLAFDTSSFSFESSRRAAQSARVFVDRLQPNDEAGVYAFPAGPRVTPTPDRAPVRAALDAVTGRGQPLQSQFHLTPGEVIDINAELGGMAMRPNFGVTQRGGQAAAPDSQTEAMRRVMLRECGSDTDIQCAQNIEREATTLAMYYEAEVTREVDNLGTFIRTLANVPGRKTVVVFSGGMPVADRPGGRPSLSDLARVLGEEAARANASIYALFFDSTFFQLFSAETRRSSRNPISQERESAVMSRFLNQFASSSGGTMIPIAVGGGEEALAQILRETSTYYLLGVAPAAADRDGRTHRLKVKVDARGATIRSRSWVQIPRK